MLDGLFAPLFMLFKDDAGFSTASRTTPSDDAPCISKDAGPFRTDEIRFNASPLTAVGL